MNQRSTDSGQRWRGTLLAAIGLSILGGVGAVGATPPPRSTDGVAPIFAGGFESGNTLGWSSRQPPLPAPDAYRAGDLDLRDPHVFVDLPGFGCFDFTDTPLPLGLGPSLNAQLATSIANDEDLDSLLDLSVILGFRPFDPAAGGERLDQGTGACTAPLATTQCDWQIPPVPHTTVYDGVAAGACAGVVAGTTSGYSPAPAAPLAPCLESQPRLLPFELLGASVDLESAQVSAEIVAGVDLEGGLLLGFLSEADAANVLLPPDLPVVGGQPITVLLPGGAGNCAAGDDRDNHLGESGWWFYFDFQASPVSFVGS